MDSSETSGALRATVTRKELLRLGAALFGGAAVAGMVGSPAVHAGGGGDGQGDGSDRRQVGPPRPVPGGFNDNFDGFVPSDPSVHAFAPAVGLDLSTITDFKGVVAACEMQGDAHGSDGTKYWFDADMRFMQGTYIDLHGRRREHAFGFV